jgi:hypothetical protein
VSFDLQVFEECGPVVNGRGAVYEITNINFKNFFDYNTPYYYEFASIQRPDKYTLGHTYNKYIFFKIFGDLPDIKDLKITISSSDPGGDTASCTKIRMFYGMTNTYRLNDGTFDGSLLYLPTQVIIYPSWGIGSPSAANERSPHIFPGTKTLFTNYLKMQMHVEGDEDWKNVGNTPQYNLKLEFKSF